jgi:hypothetical protein
MSARYGLMITFNSIKCVFSTYVYYCYNNNSIYNAHSFQTNDISRNHKQLFDKSQSISRDGCGNVFKLNRTTRRTATVRCRPGRDRGTPNATGEALVSFCLAVKRYIRHTAVLLGVYTPRAVRHTALPHPSSVENW